MGERKQGTRKVAGVKNPGLQDDRCRRLSLSATATLTYAQHWLPPPARLCTQCIVVIVVIAHDQGVGDLAARPDIGVAADDAAVECRALHSSR